MIDDNRLSSPTPLEMAQKAVEAGVYNANLSNGKAFLMSVLAGAFIALGAAFSTATLAGSSGFPYGLSRVLAGLTFCLGLILVVVGGAELFTGNSLMVIATASGKISISALLRNWVIAYLGNFMGSISIAILMLLAKQYAFGAGSVGEVALSTASSKVHLGFVQAIALGVLCNMLVCLAVWLTYSGRNTTDKILAILFPITAFVTIGFEHSVANMYFIPYGLLIQQFDPHFIADLGNKVGLEGLTWSAFFLKNLLPVTVGNIIGGGFFVSALYWLIYLRGSRNA